MPEQWSIVQKAIINSAKSNTLLRGEYTCAESTLFDCANSNTLLRMSYFSKVDIRLLYAQNAPILTMFIDLDMAL